MLTTPDSAFFARVDGIEFTGRRFDHTPGFYVTGVEGLILGGTVSYESVPSGSDDQGDGELDVPNVRTSPRIITLTGFVYARSMWELGQMLVRLSGALADDAGWFGWEEFGEQYRAWVRRGVNSPPQRLGATGRANYTIRFRAPSQRVYGLTVHKDGPAASVRLVNRGNFPALPVLSVRGDMPAGYRIVCGGEQYIVSRPVVPGQTHRIDMRDRVLVVGGIADPNGVVRSGRIQVPRSGAASIELVPNAGAGTIAAEWADNFI